MATVLGSAGGRIAASPLGPSVQPVVGATADPVVGPFADPAAEPYRSLAELVAAMDALAAAVVRHDARALEAATATATDLVARIERLAADGLGIPAAATEEPLIGRLAHRLAASARLAAQLIERAWSSEAAALQLLARCLGSRLDGETYRPGSPASGTASYRRKAHVLERQA